MAKATRGSESFGFEGREIPIHAGDTIGSALYRAGIDTVSRSFKYHRRRGFLCMSGDCPNCLVTVDDEPCTRSCLTPAEAGLRVARMEATDFGVIDAASDGKVNGFLEKPFRVDELASFARGLVAPPR